MFAKFFTEFFTKVAKKVINAIQPSQCLTRRGIVVLVASRCQGLLIPKEPEILKPECQNIKKGTF